MRRAALSLVFRFVLLGALAWSASCGTPTFVVQQYAGPARAGETIAILRVDGAGKVQLLSLDGEATDARVTPDARLHIEILPGNHRLWVASLAAEGAAQPLSFVARAGRFYRVEFVAGAPRIYEVDESSNALKADVTAAETAPAEAPAPEPPRVTAKAPVIVEQSTPSPGPVDAGASLAPPSSPSDSGAPAP